MKPKNIIWIVALVAVAGVLGYSLAKPSSSGIKNVDAAGVRAAIADGAQVVDVRTAGEFQLGHIDGAINVPLDQLSSQAESWDRKATYVVYCATGARSATAVETMKSMGFENIRHFNAGIQAWDGQLAQGVSAAGKKFDTAGKPLFIEFSTDS